MSLDDIRPEDWNRVRKDFYRDRTAGQEMNDYAEQCLVDKPAHYNAGAIEAIEYIKQQTGDGFKDYLYGNAMKYLHRHRYKGKPVEDLRKAVWYIQRMIKEEVQ